MAAKHSVQALISALTESPAVHQHKLIHAAEKRVQQLVNKPDSYMSFLARFVSAMDAGCYLEAATILTDRLIPGLSYAIYFEPSGYATAAIHREGSNNPVVARAASPGMALAAAVFKLFRDAAEPPQRRLTRSQKSEAARWTKKRA